MAKTWTNQEQWHRPLILVLGRQMQSKLCELWAFLVYIRKFQASYSYLVRHWLR